MFIRVKGMHTLKFDDQPLREEYKNYSIFYQFSAFYEHNFVVVIFIDRVGLCLIRKDKTIK